MLSQPATVAVVLNVVVDSVILTVRAGALASVQVRVEALGRGDFGWLCAAGYGYDDAPILVCIADADVLEIEVEAGPAAEDSDEAVEWAEAA